ncbi:hypothetical protein SDRG_08347 [Saprolegnia diclina VS20]|uniref:NmrA-like domain-containing protein n=1 Tax=Saprolegnia diclina (strain VS20) TaxID=1156394 RepID=T0RNZ7_SAPDV|nr:hypothetical protein SDRG_08347 [Saprolegnia diclina VS20]EQC34138.1 hypothetical protein SDRG_08347 [Saprolegnia diclina VS20]|eukprot:XP_008612450.1 hypothetical protein SDRG_08347 [Saprolegnia diclina VS20]
MQRFMLHGASLLKPTSAAGALGRMVLGLNSTSAFGREWQVVTARVDHAEAVIRHVHETTDCRSEFKPVGLSLAEPSVDAVADQMKRLGSTGLLLLPDAIDTAQWDATQTLLKAAKAAKLEHLVLVSTATSAADSMVPSGKAWFELESAAEATQIPLSIVHPSTLMDTFLYGKLHEMVCGRTLSVTNEAARIAFVDGRDVADVVNRLVSVDAPVSTTLHVTGPAALSMQEVAATLSRHLVPPVKYSKFPLWAVQTAMWVQGKRPEEIQELVNLSRYYEAQYEAETSTTVHDMLGRAPRSLEQFVADHKEDWPQHKYS